MNAPTVIYKSIVGKGIIASRFSPESSMIVVWVKEETLDAIIGHELTLEGEVLTVYPKKDYKFFLVGEQIH
jgi:hypothetical protein